MQEFYKSSEGVYFDEYDSLNYIRWKVKDLREQGLSDKQIKLFDEDPFWILWIDSLLKELYSTKT